MSGSGPESWPSVFFKSSGDYYISGGGHGNPLQYSCLENPMDRGAWWATVQSHKESDRTEVA